MKSTLRLVLMALFLGIGTALYAIVPSFVFGMRPDMLLSAMFLSIFFLVDRRSILILGLATGVLSGLLSTMAGGFVPNIIDKLITSLVIFGLFLALRKIMKPIISAAVLTAIGTLVSGTVFLGSMSIMASLPLSFTSLFITVVLPAAVINTVFVAIVYPIVSGIMSRAGFKTTSKQNLSA